MRLNVLLCDKVVPGIRVLVLTRGFNTNARIMIDDRIAFKYYGNILKHSKLFGSNYVHEPTHLIYARTSFGGYTMGDN